MTTCRGLDLSNNNGTVAFQQVAAAGYQFVLLKASEGTTFRDGFLAQDWRDAKAAGLARSAYHFARPSASSPEVQADFFLSCVDAAGGLETGDCLALDIEAGNGDLLDWVTRFLARVDVVAGFHSFIYTGQWFAQPHNLLGDAKLAEYGLWWASYTATEPAAPPLWDFIAIWQNSDTGTAPGVVGAVDENVFAGTIEQFRLYGKPAPVPPAPPEPPQPPGKQPTNDDLIAAIRYLLMQPADLAGLEAYLQPFRSAVP